MLQALLKGKLSREQENMEDILTSNVFGLLKYVPPGEGLLNYLAFAEEKGGNHPLEFLNSLNDGSKLSIEYEFWPRWEESNCIGCEPDVAIKLEISDKQDLLVLIEAKYWSGKSPGAVETADKPNDQLAKEWDNLSVRVGRLNKKPVLIYLTKHYAYPHQDIEEAINEYKNKRPGGTEPGIYWLSWRHLRKVCENTDNPILNDLSFLLERLNLKFFDGVKLEEVHIPWFFE